MSLTNLPLRLLANRRHSIFIFHKVPASAPDLVPDEVDLAQFESLLDYIADNFKVVPLEECIPNFRNRSWNDRLASITFDDGYADWATTALPALQQRNMPATFFITTGQFFGTPLWHERIIHAITKTTLTTLNLTIPEAITLPVSNQNEKIVAIAKLERFAKYLPLSTRHSLLGELESVTGVSPHDVPVMSLDDLRQMHNLGHGIGAHTHFHAILTQCDDTSARNEIAHSREILSGIIGAPISGFAYPNGVPDKDFSSTHIALVKAAGYRFAVTTTAGAANKDSSPYQLPRFTPWKRGRLGAGYQIARNLRHSPLQISEGCANKNVLMVAFHFPPQSGSSGILRTLNYVKHLPSYGWQPTVLTASVSAYEKISSELENTIPPGTHIVRAFSLDTSRHLSFAGKYLRLMAIPDRWVSWLFAACFAGGRIIRKEAPELIWSTYPLATTHLIGGMLAQRFNLPWVADFRDPMIVSDTYPEDSLERWAKQRIEAFTMRHAAYCVFTTTNAAELHKSRYPDAAHKCIVLPNGFDSGAFERIRPDRHGIPEDTLLLLHSGIIYPKERDPSSFFAAISQLIRNGKISQDKIAIRFRGSQNDSQIAQAARCFGLEKIVELMPPISYAEAISEMAGADILLVFQGSQFNTQVPAKIYEYLRTGTQVLGIVDPMGNTAAELLKFNGALLADINRIDDIVQVLTNTLIHPHAESEKVNLLATNLEKLAPFTRENQTKQLAKLFQETSNSVNIESEKIKVEGTARSKPDKSKHGETFNSALRWLAAGRIAGQIVSWVITVLVIRLLTPADYGMAAMIITVTSLITIVAEFGFGVAIIQAKDITKEQISAVSGAAITFGAAAFLLGTLIAPLAAAYYMEPHLKVLVQIAVTNFFIISLGTTPDSILRREHKYSLLAAIDFISTLIGSVTTLLLAYGGYGVIALVMGTIGTSCTRVIALYITNKDNNYKPRLSFSEAIDFIGYGSKVTVSRTSAYIVSQSDILIGGRLLGKETMGFYFVALDLAMLPLTKMMNIINQAATPTLAEIKHQDHPEQKIFLLITLRLLGYLIIPCLWGMATISPWLVPVMLGEKWEPAIIPLQIICTALPARMLTNLTSTALIAFGYVSIDMRNQLFGIAIFPFAYFIGANFGITGLAISLAISLPVIAAVALYSSESALGISIREAVISLLPPICMTGVMSVFISILGKAYLYEKVFANLVVLIIIGALIYVTILFIFDKRSFKLLSSSINIRRINT